MNHQKFFSVAAILVGLLAASGRGQSSASFKILRSGIANTAGIASSSSFRLAETAMGVVASESARSTNFVLNGSLIITEVEERGVASGGEWPQEFYLEQNYPNPFNPQTTIRYGLAEVEEVRFIVYNALGQEVRSLTLGKQRAGFHLLHWDGKDDLGRDLPSGVYVYRLVTGKFSRERKMTLLR